MVLVIISVAWIPIINNFKSGQLFVYIQQISAYLSPQIAAIFVLAVLWSKTKESVSFNTIMKEFD